MPLQANMVGDVLQKYDLVSKNDNDQEEIFQNCKFQHQIGPEPEDSEGLERMSLRSSQTLNVIAATRNRG